MPDFHPQSAQAGTVRETTIGSVLRDAASRAPDADALVDGDPDPSLRRQWTFAGLLAEAERTARALLTRFSPGERVAIWSPNRPEWVILEFAAALAGLTLVTVNPAYQGEELAHVLGHSEADGLFYPGGQQAGILAEIRGRLPKLREVLTFEGWGAFTAAGNAGLVAARPLPFVNPSSAAQVLYTSGTTGRPKGAVLTHRGLTNNARIAFQTAGIGPGDVEINPMPMFHVGGSALFTLGAVQATATQVLMPRFSPALELELIEAYRVTVLCGVPTMLLALLSHPDRATRDVSSLRMIFTGGAASPPALVHRTEAELDLVYTIGYAQTEAGCVLTMTTAADAAADRAETLGLPLPGTELRIADLRTGETAGCGETGEICARGYFVMDRYLNAPKETAAAIDAGGWLHTGDLGSLDERGYLRIAGRLKEMIIRGGENIYPREIEEVLVSHPAVADASVVGVPDEYYGEVVGAAIHPVYDGGSAPDDNVLASELDAFCRARLATEKVPARWLITAAFPMTPSGKIRKDDLRDQLIAAAPDSG
ncbi:MAG TPA: AMP-binding protein [Trebonia sp.]|nr:AMP-binding protein [Trebonia sp.]